MIELKQNKVKVVLNKEALDDKLVGNAEVDSLIFFVGKGIAKKRDYHFVDEAVRFPYWILNGCQGITCDNDRLIVLDYEKARIYFNSMDHWCDINQALSVKGSEFFIREGEILKGSLKTASRYGVSITSKIT